MKIKIDTFPIYISAGFWMWQGIEGSSGGHAAGNGLQHHAESCRTQGMDVDRDEHISELLHLTAST